MLAANVLNVLLTKTLVNLNTSGWEACLKYQCLAWNTKVKLSKHLKYQCQVDQTPPHQTVSIKSKPISQTLNHEQEKKCGAVGYVSLLSTLLLEKERCREE